MYLFYFIIYHTILVGYKNNYNNYIKTDKYKIKI